MHNEIKGFCSQDVLRIRIDQFVLNKEKAPETTLKGEWRMRLATARYEKSSLQRARYVELHFNFFGPQTLHSFARNY